MSRATQKGKRGENEFCEWLCKNLNIKTDRIYNQASGHSADVSTDHFLFEVKRREQLSLSNWWHQVVVAKKYYENPDIIPVVAFRQNRQQWEFLLPANLLYGLDRGFIRLEEKIFIQLAISIIEK